MSTALQTAIDEVAKLVEESARVGGDPAELRDAATRLAEARAAGGSLAERAEALVIEAGARQVAWVFDRRDAASTLRTLDDAVAAVRESWPALRVSVLTRAMALAAPLANDNVIGEDAVGRLTSWSALLVAARERQRELAVAGQADLEVAAHVSARLSALDPADADKMRAHASQLAQTAFEQLSFAGDAAGITAASRTLADLKSGGSRAVQRG